MKRVIIIVSVMLVLVVLAVFKLKSNQKTVKDKLFKRDASAEVYVETASPETHTFENSFSFLGTFEPNRQSTIGADIGGKIIDLNVQEGDRISQGKVIAKIDDEMLQLQLESADIGLEGQRNDDNRYSNLAKENAVAGVQVEKTKLGLRAAEVQKKQIQKQIRNTSIKAPYSGVVTRKLVDLGSVVGAGTPVIELTDISTLKLTVSVPERDVMKFRLGQEVSIFVDIYDNKVFKGKVSNINVQADKAHNFKIQITVKNERSEEIMAGMYGSVRLNNDESVTRLSIPRKALVGSSKNPKVYVVRNGKAELVAFNAGTSDGEYIEVVSGLKKGDQIVVKGQVNLEDKSPVTTKAH